MYDDDGEDFREWTGGVVHSYFPRRRYGYTDGQREFIARLDWEAQGFYRYGRDFCALVNEVPYVLIEIETYVLTRYENGERWIRFRHVVDGLKERDWLVRKRFWDNLFAPAKRYIRMRHPDKPEMFEYRPIRGLIDLRVVCPQCFYEFPEHFRLVKLPQKRPERSWETRFSDVIDQLYRYQEDEEGFWKGPVPQDEPDWRDWTGGTVRCHWPKEE